MSKIKIIIYIDRFTTAIVLIVGTNQLTPNNYPRNAFLEDFLVKFHIFSACGANKYTISVRTTVFSPGPYATGGIFIWSTQQIDRSDRNPLENPPVLRKTMVHKLVVFTFIGALLRAEMVVLVEEMNEIRIHQRFAVFAQLSIIIF